MLIRNAALEFQWQKKFPAVFLLLGQEPVQLNAVAAAIIRSWQIQHPDEVDRKTLYVMDADGWSNVTQEANSYSLFSTVRLLDIRFDKKAFDAAAKNFLQAYVGHSNPQCLLIIRAPHVPYKQVQATVEKIGATDQLQVILSTLPTASSIQTWIAGKLRGFCSQYDPHVPALIYRYTEGNLSATVQLLEKLALACDPGTPLTETTLRAQLNFEASYTLFELADFCLKGDAPRALQFLRQAALNKTEPLLVLWLLAQEARTLLQLAQADQRGENIQDKARQLKVWSNKTALYQKAIKRLRCSELEQVLVLCAQLDMGIKTGQRKPVWQLLELIVVTLCTGKGLGHVL